ncbi:DUF5309 family protein [Candidatus Neomarinimicrobiota bacterium]
MDYIQLADLTGQTESYAGSQGSSLSTGDLRRTYNFGPAVSELNIAQDPFFRFASKVMRKPTDDPEFKFTERRPSWHKRYAYIIGHGASAVATNDATIDGSTGPNTDFAVGDTYIFRMATDYKSSGNIQNVYGQSTNAISVGATGTRPEFFVPGQIIKTNLCAAVTAIGTAPTVGDYMLWKIVTVTKNTDDVDLAVILVRNALSDTNREFTSFVSATAALSTVYNVQIRDNLERRRTYITGSAHSMGSGYPETWMDEPFSTGYGKTQIWKTTMSMDNTTRATVLKYEPNEWARVWKEKLIEHKWDIETSMIFGAQDTVDGVRYTEGAVNYITNYGNVFSLDTTSKTADDFLDDMSSYYDPRYNSSGATIFFCDTTTYNWLHKLSGYFQNNLEISTNFRADMSFVGSKRIQGVPVDTIRTKYGDINLVRNVHLDGTWIKILAIDMRHCSYRPLVGNGLNRDTSIHVGVQTLENSGIDRRVDLIQTEAGMQWGRPEAHAIWS